MPSLPPAPSLMSQGFAQFPSLPMKPFQSLSIGRATFPLWSTHLAPALIALHGWMAHYHVFEPAPHASLPLFLSSGLGVGASSSLPLILPRPSSGPQLTDTRGVLMDTWPKAEGQIKPQRISPVIQESLTWARKEGSPSSPWEYSWLWI